jgi:hypothetical protein
MKDTLRRAYHKLAQHGRFKESFGNDAFGERARRVAPDDAPPIVAVAEGDSWFDYPLTLDFLDHLQASDWVNVWRESHFGHKLADMAGAQLDATIAQVQAVRPDVFLLSCGGNDIMGSAELLRQVIRPAGARARPSDPYLDHAALKAQFGVLRRHLDTLTGRVLAAAEAVGRGDLRILVHGYDYAFPDGRAVLPAPLVGRLLPGPWLSPALVHHGYLKSPTPRAGELPAAVAVVRELMDAWNAELSEFAEQRDGAVVHVNLLGSLPDRRKHWHNETHPNEAGFGIVAGKMLAEVLRVTRRG